MNNSFLNSLTPKEPKFFPLLKQMADVMFVASNLMIENVEKGDHESAIEYNKKIKEQEKIGDTLSNKVFDELNTTFITPFDREDIHHLANRLDDVTDRINSCSKRIVLYNPKKMPQSAVDLAKVLRECTVCIGKAVDELDVLKKSSKKIKAYCIELHWLHSRRFPGRPGAKTTGHCKYQFNNAFDEYRQLTFANLRCPLGSHSAGKRYDS